MVLIVTDRNETKKPFDEQRIINAIDKAAKATSETVDNLFITSIANSIKMLNSDNITVDEIQRQVESYLMKSEYEETAKAYITYRKKRDLERNSKFLQTYHELVEIEDTDLKNDNANMNGDTPAGQMMKFASVNTNDYTDGYLINPKYVEAHNKGLIHIHDKDYYPTKTTTCVQYDMSKLFKNGFNPGHGYLREPNSIRSAGALAAIAFQTCQNEQHGGQSIPAFDYFMAPYVTQSFRKYIKKYYLREMGENSATIEQLDFLYQDIKIGNEYLKARLPYIYKYALEDTIAETEQSMEAFIANMNSMHSRGGNQVVFSSINYGTDTSVEGRMIITALLKATEQGLGRGETPIFPIQIFKVKNGVNYSEEDFSFAMANIEEALNNNLNYNAPNFDLFIRSCVVSSKRLFPNFVFLDASFNQNDKWDANDPERFKYELATMGCRTRVYDNRFGEKTSWGRGNLSFTTVNLVRIALEAKSISAPKNDNIIDVFYNKLIETFDFVAEQLIERYQFQCTAKAKQFPFLMGQGIWSDGEKLSPRDRVEELLKNGSISIGFIGLAETLKVLIGKHHGESDKAQTLGLSIVKSMRDMCNKFADKYNLNFSLLSTPAEGLSGRFTSIDRKQFGIIKGVTDREYYTNSSHIPVYYNISAFDKIRIEAPYHALTNAGHILYVEMDTEAKKNISAFMQLVDQMKKADAGYVSINHPVDRCTRCGFEAEIGTSCPQCGDIDHIDRIRRITGYLVGTLDRWNSYKQAEERDRVKHIKGSK